MAKKEKVTIHVKRAFTVSSNDASIDDINIVGWIEARDYLVRTIRDSIIEGFTDEEKDFAFFAFVSGTSQQTDKALEMQISQKVMQNTKLSTLALVCMQLQQTLVKKRFPPKSASVIIPVGRVFYTINMLPIDSEESIALGGRDS